jgi:hypothetical protein
MLFLVRELRSLQNMIRQLLSVHFVILLMKVECFLHFPSKSFVRNYYSFIKNKSPDLKKNPIGMYNGITAGDERRQNTSSRIYHFFEENFMYNPFGSSCYYGITKGKVFPRSSLKDKIKQFLVSEERFIFISSPR